MIDNILKYLNENKNKSYNINELQSIFLLDLKELTEILNSLVKENLIFENEKEYRVMPKEYITGQLQTTKKGSKYLQLEDGERIYIKNENLNGALDFDTVIIGPEEENGKIKWVVKKILERKNPNIVCEVKNYNGIKNLVAFNVPGNISFKIDKTFMDKLVDGDRIIVSMPVEKTNNYYEASFVRHLCHKDDPDKDIKTIAASKDFILEFSEKTLEEVNKIPNHVRKEDIVDRVDFRDEVIFTIDGANTKDMDDAVSLKILPNGNFLLGVHIAHVSHYVKYGSAIFDEAYERGTSAYLLDYVIPMIHHILSNGICSLNEKEDRLTRSCVMEIDGQGNIVNYKIFKSVINSQKKMTYEDINQILENGIIPEGYEEYAKTIKNMEKLSDILTRKRKRDGALDFASNEIKVSLDSSGQAVDFNLVSSGLGEKLIENFMVLTNEIIASHVYWQNLPFIYRIHECPTENILNSTIKFISELGYRVNSIKDCSNPKILQSILKNLEDYDEFPILSNLLLRSMKRAIYSTHNVGHFGLASDMYTHFTSPIRRFPDLMIHTLLDEYETMYEKDSYNPEEMNLRFIKLESFLKEACAHSSYKEKQADLAEEEANKFKMMEYMKEYIGQTFEATILMINNYTVSIKTDNQILGKVLINDIAGDSFIFDIDKCRLIGKHSHQKYKIGNRISVTVKDVVPEEKEIYFYINENLSIKEKDKIKTLKKDITRK